MEIPGNEIHRVDDPENDETSQARRSVTGNCETDEEVSNMLAERIDEHAAPSTNAVETTLTAAIDSPEGDILPPIENAPLKCGMTREGLRIMYNVALGQGIALIATCMNAASFTLAHKFDVKTQVSHELPCRVPPNSLIEPKALSTVLGVHIYVTPFTIGPCRYAAADRCFTITTRF